MPNPIKMLRAYTFCLTIAAQAAVASDDNGEFVVRGIGFQKCSYVSDDYTRNRNKQLGLSSWIAGYITHANMKTSMAIDLLPIKNTSQFAALVALICKSRPDSQIHNLVAAVTDYFTPYYIHRKSSYINIKSERNQIDIREETVKVVQKLLSQKGFLPETDIDGRLNDATKKAILNFQKTSGNLPISGVPDILTLYALLDKAS